MATKKQKRERAEAKRAAFMAEVKAQGLAAQKAGRDRQRQREERLTASAQKILQHHRTILPNKSVNPRTGLLFTDEEMVVMKEKANAAERIVEGRAGTLNEQPPLNMSDYSAEADAYGFADMTVGEFRDKMDKLYTGMGWNL